MKPILIASDHAGVELKQKIHAELRSFAWTDLGPFTTDRVDYPDFARKLASLISNGSNERGILICGSGIGMSIAANRFPQVRAALAWNLESAQLSREHNNANILCLGARLIDADLAIKMTSLWLNTEFSTDGRHALRVHKMG